MTRDEKIMKRVKEHYDEACSLGKEVVAIFLQGSQNYNLDEYSDEYMSDIDTKCIILPTLNDIVSGKSPYSSTHICNNNEHIDIKDIRVYHIGKREVDEAVSASERNGCYRTLTCKLGEVGIMYI